MSHKNSIFIASSLDGYIADKEGGIDYLHNLPNPTGDDMGYTDFTSGIDAIIMGRTTFQTVLAFDIEWPYSAPVFVLSNTLTAIPESHKGKAYIARGPLNEVLAGINGQGFNRLYVDGGKTIQSFLQEDLIDEMIITTIPILLSGGFSLFGALTNPLSFRCVETNVLLNTAVQSRFVRVR